MSSVDLVLVAVAGVSAIIYWMMTRLGSPRPARRSTYDGSSIDSNFGSTGSGSGDGWNLSSWFGGRAWSSDNSCAASDSSSSNSWSDSSSCSDSGGGGGDGGGGGGDSGGGGDGGGGGGGD